MAKRTKETITIGSAIPYIMEYDATVGMPTRDEICVAENRLGYIKGGAAVEYTAEPHTEKDDLGYASKVIVVEEEALVKLGLITWNGATLKYLADRCKVEEANGLRTIKIGGAGNAQGKEWVICLHHQDKKDGDLWVIIRCVNSTGITLTLAMDEGTLLEPEFLCLPQDDAGTLIYMEEETATA